MEDIAKLVSNYGVCIVIVGCFLWDWLKNKNKSTDALTKMSECLNEMKNSNSNTAKSLELLQKSMDNQMQTLTRIENKLERNDSYDGKNKNNS